MRTLKAAAALLIALRAPAAAQDLPFLRPAEYGALANEVSGDAAYEHLRFTTQFHKPRGGSEGLMAIAQYVAERAREYGLDDVRLIRQPASNPAWNARGAELWVEAAGRPDQGAPPWERLASLVQSALHLADQSQSAEVTAEIVDVGSGTDSAAYAGRDVRGKLVLAYGSLFAVVRQAVARRGAAGVISRPDPTGAQALDFPDQIRWSTVPLATDTVPGAFAFVLSHRQGVALSRRLAQGPVRGRAQVAADLDTTQHWQVMVEGLLPGTEPGARAVVLTAHMQEEKYSANDDGSGVASLLEIARSLARLEREGALPRKRRPIRFWWVTEISSERQYFADHPEEIARLWVNINQDMVGANQGQDLLRVQNVTHVPWTRAHFLDDVAQRLVDFMVRANSSGLPIAQAGTPLNPYPRTVVARLGTRHRYNAEMVPFHNNTDHMTFNEAPVGVPAITFTNWPDNYIHTSDDDLWNIDRTQLQRNALTVAAMAFFLARSGDADVPALAAVSTGHALARLAEAYRRALLWLAAAPAGAWDSAYKTARWHLEAVGGVSAAQVRSVLEVASGEPARRLVARGAAQVEAETGARLADLDAVARELSGRAPPAIRLSETEQRLQRVVPTLAGGPAEFFSGRSRVAGESGLHNLMAFEVANAVDGRRSGLDIYRLVAAEAQAAGSYYYGTVSPEAVERHLAALAAAGLVRLRP